MQGNQFDGFSGSRVVQRIGFWFGVALFVALLFVPTTDTMKTAGRQTVRAELRQEIERHNKRLPGESAASVREQVDAYIATHAAWFEREAATRARNMMPAAAVTAMVACWWMTVAIPIPAAAIVPLVLFPLLGVMSIDAAAVNYANEYVFLFLGGFIIALGLERCGLHKRMALHVVRLIGGGRATIILGFMVAGAAISMWISNTATTLMMLPIAMAVVGSIHEMGGRDDAAGRNFGAALMLGIAYACSVGGIATPIGTPPNVAFMGEFHEIFPDAPSIGFGQWMIAFVPLVAIFLPIVWLVLTRITCRLPRTAVPVDRDVIRSELRGLGPMSPAERRMLVIFVITALLWIFRKSIHVGRFTIPGWADLLTKLWPNTIHPAFLSDATVAMGVAALLFMLPGDRNATGRRQPLMDWQTAERLPWGILLLFGGGFAIADAFMRTGLSAYVGRGFAIFQGAPPFVLVIGTCLLVTFLTELTSNTATTLVMLPIVAEVAETFGVNPLLLMLPATVSASCAFMLPVATPPNAIVFASGRVRMGQMVRTGLVLNFVGVAVVSTLMYLLVLPILGATADPPAWAR